MANPVSGRLFQRGSLSVDAGARVASLGGEHLDLTWAEFELLLALIAQAGIAVSSRDLLWAMWGEEWSTSTSALQAHVSRLRAKLGESGARPRLIVTVHGFGYRFEPNGIERPEAPPLLPDRGATDSTIYALVSLDRVVVWVSPNVERVLGIPRASVEGRTAYSLMHPDDVQASMDVAGELDAGRSAGFMVRIQAPDGTSIPMETLVRPILGSDGNPTAFLGQWRPRPMIGDVGSASEGPIRLRRDDGGS